MIINERLKKESIEFPNQDFEVIIVLEKNANTSSFEHDLNIENLGVSGVYSAILSGKRILELEQSSYKIETIKYDTIASIFDLESD